MSDIVSIRDACLYVKPRLSTFLREATEPYFIDELASQTSRR